MVGMRADLKLPERTRNRIQAEGDIQRQQKPHDIRSAIPLVDYTNPAKFPPYMFREYPKMPLLDGNKPIVIDDAGGVLVFYDAADEVEFKDMNPEIADEIERNQPAKQAHERLQDLESEVEELRRKLRAAGIEADEPRSGGLASLVRPNRVVDEDDHQPGLKQQVREAAERAEAGKSAPGAANPLKKKSSSKKDN